MSKRIAHPHEELVIEGSLASDVLTIRTSAFDELVVESAPAFEELVLKSGFPELVEVILLLISRHADEDLISRTTDEPLISRRTG